MQREHLGNRTLKQGLQGGSYFLPAAIEANENRNPLRVLRVPR